MNSGTGRCISVFALLAMAVGLRADDTVTFKSDVALSRVDAQVVDRDGRAITGLEARDFVLRVDGKVQPIKIFENESVPIDILLLLDVSGSMRPHVERIADAAEQALHVLAEHDRIAIMEFDTRTRERLPFTSSRDESITRALNRIVRFDGFNGGTRITSAMIEAANYVQHHARPEARRAIVILTDDETQDSEDEPRVESALSHANAELSFLQAPYDPPTAGRYPGGGRRGGGGIGFPGGGGGMGIPGVGWPGGGGGGGIPGVGGGAGADPSHSAGTDTIARDTGGDTMPVSDAGALEDTLQRLRQRYALHFYMPGDTDSQARQSVRVDLSDEAKMRFAEADVRSRRVFLSGATDQRSGPTVITHQTAPVDAGPISDPDQSGSATNGGRRAAVNEDSSGPVINTVDEPSSDDSATQQQNSNSQSTTTKTPATKNQGGWPTAPSSPH